MLGPGVVPGSTEQVVDQGLEGIFASLSMPATEEPAISSELREYSRFASDK